MALNESKRAETKATPGIGELLDNAKEREDRERIDLPAVTYPPTPEEDHDLPFDVSPETPPRKPEPNPLSIPGIHDLTDLGNSQRMHDRYGDSMHWSTESHRYYVWTGKVWDANAEATVYEWAQETAKAIFDDAVDMPSQYDKGRIAKHAVRSQSKFTIDSMIHLARYQPGVSISEAAFDTDPWALNCRNGTIDLRTGDLRKHLRGDLITKMCPVAYDPNATSKRWDNFIESVTQGDKGLERFLQTAAGYSLCGEYGDEVLFFIYGPTATGKSTFKDALKAMLGSYAATADVSTFMQMKHNSRSPSSDLARLYRTRMVVTDEVNEGEKLATGLVKLYTGGDEMTARFMYKEEFEFKSRGKLWIVANFPPKVSAEDGAIWRRILRVPFLHEIPADAQDHTLKRDLCNPRGAGPAILAWAVEGCIRYQTEGLTIPDAVKRSTEEYRSEMCPINDFILARCELEHGPSADLNFGNGEFEETSAALWDAYQRWAEENGIKMPVKRDAFGKSLRLMGLKSKQRTGSDRARTWQGIRLTTRAFPEAE